jgi:hypothetical protein
MTLSGAQIRELIKCRSACIWLLFSNLFLSCMAIALTAWAFSHAIMDASEKPFQGLCLAYAVLALVYVVRLALASRRYWVLLFIPVVLLPAFG